MPSKQITTNAAVMRGTGHPWDVVELKLDPPKAHEVLIRYVASGLCHSDEHLRTEDFWAGMARFPMVGGHEGAGIIEAVGPGVTAVQEGDHVVCSFIPACGRCRWCSTGHQNLCDLGADTMRGCLPDGTFRFHDAAGEDYGGLCMLARSPSTESSRSLGRRHRQGPAAGGGRPGRVRRADRLGKRRLQRQGATGRHRPDLRVRRRRDQCRAGRQYAGAANVVAVDPVDSRGIPRSSSVPRMRWRTRPRRMT